MDKITKRSPYMRDKLEAARTAEGKILCIKCDVGYLDEKSKQQVCGAIGFHNNPQVVEISTKSCDVCGWYLVDDEQCKELRKKLA